MILNSYDDLVKSFITYIWSYIVNSQNYNTSLYLSVYLYKHTHRQIDKQTVLFILLPNLTIPKWLRYSMILNRYDDLMFNPLSHIYGPIVNTQNHNTIYLFTYREIYSYIDR